MDYEYVAIPEEHIPHASDSRFQYLIDTYASETNKTVSTWHEFADHDRSYRPDDRSTTVEGIMRHHLLSERRFFAEFMGVPEPAADQVLPDVKTVVALSARLAVLAEARLKFLASQNENWWYETVPFFDVQRQRIWVFWRRVLHSAHHRTQLTVYLRLLGKRVPATYGPSADVSWQGADPTSTVEAAQRKRA